MAIVAARGAPLVFGPAKAPPPTKIPKLVVDTKKLEKAMADLLPEIQKVFAPALDKFADRLVDEIRKGTPIMTGDLWNDVRRMKVKKTKTLTTVQAGAGGGIGKVRKKPIKYAITVHQLGSPLGRGRFFVITPSVQMAEAFLPRMVNKAVEIAVKRVGR